MLPYQIFPTYHFLLCSEEFPLLCLCMFFSYSFYVPSYSCLMVINTFPRFLKITFSFFVFWGYYLSFLCYHISRCLSWSFSGKQQAWWFPFIHMWEWSNRELWVWRGCLTVRFLFWYNRQESGLSALELLTRRVLSTSTLTLAALFVSIYSVFLEEEFLLLLLLLFFPVVVFIAGKHLPLGILNIPCVEL